MNYVLPEFLVAFSLGDRRLCVLGSAREREREGATLKQ